MLAEVGAGVELVDERRLRERRRDKVALLVAQRAAYWKQRGKFRALREGDANTRFFHARASAQARQNAIRSLDINGEQVLSHDGKVAALTTYYTDILGVERATTWNYDIDNLYAAAEQADSAALVAPFTPQEARAAVHAMSADSAPGPDGIGPGFFRVAWATVQGDVMRFLGAFHRCDVQLERINHAIIVLIPKTLAASSPKAFRPVSLQNCPVKILTKILTTRLEAQVARLVDPDQTGFIDILVHTDQGWFT